MPQRILALETAGDRVRAATAERSWNSFQLTGVFEEKRAADEPGLSAAISRIIERAGQPDITLSSLPANLAAKRLLELPFKDLRRLRQVVPFALEEHLPFPVDGAAVAFTRLGRAGDGTLVLAAVVRKQDLKNHLDVLTAAGLDPKTVTLAPLALAALFSHPQNGASRPHLVLDIDETCASALLLDAGGRPLAVRSVGVGLHINGGDVLAGPGADAILSLARNTLLAHASEVERPDLIMTGSAADSAQLRARMGQALALEVRDARDLNYAALDGGMRPATLRFAPCVAMLLGERPAHPVELLNFREGEFAFRGTIRGDIAPVRTTMILAALLVGLAVLNYLLGMGVGIYRLTWVNSQIAKAAEPVLGEVSGSEAAPKLRESIIAMRRRLGELGGNAERNSPLDTLLEVSRAVPPHLPAQLTEVEIDGSGIRATGSADSFSTVEQIKKALSQNDYFEQIEVANARASASAGTVEFTLNATLSDGVPRSK
jgi:type II secretion system protein L